ncbi:MAG: peptide ABC transporter substrate-binding protein [Gemmatimonadaceae bacterium]|nr:peptide ABC transporter substrate-binding protein [Gemmatimonadaceae bacterium]
MEHRLAGAGTVVIVTTGDADILFPPLVASTMGRQVTEQIYDYLAEVGAEMNTIGDAGFRPQLARTWAWSPDSLSISFRLDSMARWHDGQPVTSDDVRFTFAVYTDARLGSSTGSQLGNIDSVSTPDSLTAVFWFRNRTPLQFFDATSQMQVLPRHVFGGMTPDSLRKAVSGITPVGSGRFRFVSWKRGSSIELGPDTTNYRGRAGLQRVIWQVTPSPVSASTMLLAGEADLYDTMRPENVREAAADSELVVASFPGTDYVFMQFNFRDPARRNRAHPLFASRELRRALSMAVDRTAMVRNVFDSLAEPGIGPTLRVFPTTDPAIEQIPYNLEGAKKTLDSLGWRVGGDGIRERNGRRLRFSILVPASSLNRHKMGVLLQEQFRGAGAAVSLDQVEFATFSARLQARDFDAALGSFHLGASAAAVKETWTSAAARARGGLNYGSYMNPVFDALVDSATSAMDASASRRFYSAAYSTAVADAPAIWLYEPRMVLGIHRRIRTSRIRPDAWWSSLADWYVAADEQIPRDRVTR